MAQYLPSMFKALGSYTVQPNQTKQKHFCGALCSPIHSLHAVCNYYYNHHPETHISQRRTFFYKKLQRGHKQPKADWWQCVKSWITWEAGIHSHLMRTLLSDQFKQQLVNYHLCMKPSEDNTWGPRPMGCAFSEWPDSPWAMTPWGNSLGTFCSEPLCKQKPRWHDGRFQKA